MATKAAFKIAFNLGTVILAAIAIVFGAAAMGDVSLSVRLGLFVAAFLLGLPLIVWWEIPKVKPHASVRVICAFLWTAFIGIVAASVISYAEKTDIAISVDASMASGGDRTEPPPQGNGVYYLPSDPTISNRLAQEARKLGFEVGSQPIMLRLAIANKGPKAWTAFKIPLTIHYVILHGIPLDLDWGARGSIDQQFMLSNGTWPSPSHPDIPLFLSAPINSYSTLSITLINASIAYAAIEFPSKVQVQEVGGNSFVSVPLAVSGLQMLAPTVLRTEMLPPWR